MRHFWLALKEGAVEHRRALLLITGVVVGFVAVVQTLFYFASAHEAVCASCHIMKPYVEMRKESTHAASPASPATPSGASPSRRRT